MREEPNLMRIGWVEWCALPAFDVPYIKAKIDTGAKTSSLHAFDIKRFSKNSLDYVSFSIHPIQSNDKISLRRKALILDQREIMSSNGHKEKRFVIQTQLKLNNKKWDIELTLSNRDPMRFRLLLGRESLRQKVIIYPGKQTLLGKYSKQFVEKSYL